MSDNGPSVWTKARLEALARGFSRGVQDADLLAMVNAAPGPLPCSGVSAMRHKAKVLKLRRPMDWVPVRDPIRPFGGRIGVAWSPARDAALLAAIAAGAGRRDMMAAVRAVPGPMVTRSQVRYRIDVLRQAMLAPIAPEAPPARCEVAEIDWGAAMDWAERHAPAALEAEGAAAKLAVVNQARHRWGLPRFRVTVRRYFAEPLPAMELVA